MFDKLVESSITKKEDKRGQFFAVTAFLWISLLVGIIVYGIMSFKANLESGGGDQATLLAVPPPPPPPPPPAPERG